MQYISYLNRILILSETFTSLEVKLQFHSTLGKTETFKILHECLHFYASKITSSHIFNVVHRIVAMAHACQLIFGSTAQRCLIDQSSVRCSFLFYLENIKVAPFPKKNKQLVSISKTIEKNHIHFISHHGTCYSNQCE